MAHGIAAPAADWPSSVRRESGFPVEVPADSDDSVAYAQGLYGRIQAPGVSRGMPGRNITLRESSRWMHNWSARRNGCAVTNRGVSSPTSTNQTVRIRALVLSGDTIQPPTTYLSPNSVSMRCSTSFSAACRNSSSASDSALVASKPRSLKKTALDFPRGCVSLSK